MKTFIILFFGASTLQIAIADSAIPQSAPIAPPPRRLKDVGGGYYSGTVTSLTKYVVTIEGQGILPDAIAPLHGSRVFTLSETLRSGDFGHRHGYGYMYRAKQVNSGDTVRVFFDRVDGVLVCTDIMIARRPGGRVPPSAGEPVDLLHRHHERMNAHQDYEEHGIPFPEKYRPLILPERIKK